MREFEFLWLLGIFEINELTVGISNLNPLSRSATNFESDLSDFIQKLISGSGLGDSGNFFLVLALTLQSGR